MYKIIIPILLFLLPLTAQEIVGTWKLSNKEKPFKFSSAVSHEMNFQFNADGTMQLLTNHANAFGSTRHYEVDGNKLKVVLKNKNSGVAHNFGLGIFSSQTLLLTQIDWRCFNAIDADDRNNVFVMCKIK